MKVVKSKFSFSKLFPNMVTIAAICFGLSSIRYALDAKWEISVFLIMIAGFLDVVDGRLARYLKATSNFGAYLDSLADFINFGVAPAIVLYLWNLKYISFKGVGWALVLFYVICAAIRLARFNSDLDDDTQQDWQSEYFKGVPAPMGAILLLTPMMISFQFAFPISYLEEILAFYLIIIGALLVSTIPTFSTKKLTISKEYLSLFYVVVGIIIALLIIEPWLLLSTLSFIYLLCIFFSIKSFRKSFKM